MPISIKKDYSSLRLKSYIRTKHKRDAVLWKDSTESLDEIRWAELSIYEMEMFVDEEMAKLRNQYK